MTDPPPADRDMQDKPYAELWLSEMWPTVRQYPPPKALPARLRRRRLSMPPAPDPSPNGDA